jgi:hypothetical protein
MEHKRDVKRDIETTNMHVNLQRFSWNRNLRNITPNMSNHFSF